MNHVMNSDKFYASDSTLTVITTNDKAIQNINPKKSIAQNNPQMTNVNHMTNLEKFDLDLEEFDEYKFRRT